MLPVDQPGLPGREVVSRLRLRPRSSADCGRVLGWASNHGESTTHTGGCYSRFCFRNEYRSVAANSPDCRSRRCLSSSYPNIPCHLPNEQFDILSSGRMIWTVQVPAANRLLVSIHHTIQDCWRSERFRSWFTSNVFAVMNSWTSITVRVVWLRWASATAPAHAVNN